MDGTRRTRERRTACRTSGLTATSLIISLPSAIRAAASPGRISRAACCCGTTSTSSNQPTGILPSRDMAVDLLVFGPHPDDLEIGVGGALGEPWKIEWICYYFINDGATPSFLVDVSEYYERKRQALACHASQFQPGPNAVGTRLNSPLFRQLVESLDAQFGAQAGVTWAEGVVVREPVT